eukprot:496775_1
MSDSEDASSEEEEIISLDEVQNKFAEKVGHKPHSVQKKLAYSKQNNIPHKFRDINKWWPTRPEPEAKPVQKAVNADDYKDPQDTIPFSANSDDVSSLIDRIKYILSFYREWIAIENKESIYSIINDGFGTNTDYNINSFLSDYYFVVDDQNKEVMTTAIQHINDETDGICDAEICRVINRTNDSASINSRRQHYFCKQGDDSQAANRNISTQQILDALHIYIYHTLRVDDDECNEPQTEDDDNDEQKENDDIDEQKEDDLYEDKVSKKISILIKKAQTSKRFR